jgi:hypothetical protein
MAFENYPPCTRESPLFGRSLLWERLSDFLSSDFLTLVDMLPRLLPYYLLQGLFFTARTCFCILHAIGLAFALALILTGISIAKWVGSWPVPAAWRS